MTTTAAPIAEAPAHRMMQSLIGLLLLEADDRAVRRITITDEGTSASAEQADASLAVTNALKNRLEDKPARARLLDRLEAELRLYFRGSLRRFSVPLAPSGTAFQRAVWSQLRRLGWGQTATYRDLAMLVDRPAGARAVGGACGANPIPIVIPCHRVIASGGGLGGFGSGLRRKQWLLNHESTQIVAT